MIPAASPDHGSPEKESRSEHAPSRRTIVKAAAWSTPAILTAIAVPASQASGALRVTIDVPGGSGCVEVGDELPDLVVSVRDNTAVVPNATVILAFSSSDSGTLEYDSQTYPGAGSVVLTTDTQGRAVLRGAIAGTSGTISVTALAQTSDGRSAQSVAAVYSICCSVSSIFWTSDGRTAHPADSAQTVRNPQVLAVASSFAYVVDGVGTWYVHQNAVDGPWQRISVPSPVSKIVAAKGSDYGLAIVDGIVYRSAATATAVALDGVSGVVDVAASGNYLYALDGSGNWYWMPLNGASGSWNLISGTPSGRVEKIFVNEPGLFGFESGYGWALADGAAYFVSPGASTGNTAINSDNGSGPEGKLPEASDLSIGQSWAYALTFDKRVFAHFAAAAGPWRAMTGLPDGKADAIYNNLGVAGFGNYGWALRRGDAYWSNDGAVFHPADTAGTITGRITQLCIAGDYAYALTDDGAWYSHYAAQDTPWVRIEGIPGGRVSSITSNFGNFGWAISNGSC